MEDFLFLATPTFKPYNILMTKLIAILAQLVNPVILIQGLLSQFLNMMNFHCIELTMIRKRFLI